MNRSIASAPLSVRRVISGTLIYTLWLFSAALIFGFAGVMSQNLNVTLKDMILIFAFGTVWLLTIFLTDWIKDRGRPLLYLSITLTLFSYFAFIVIKSLISFFS